MSDDIDNIPSMPRMALISYTVPDAWESWIIQVNDPDAPEELTEDWLLANSESWEWYDMKDRGGDGMTDIVVEDQEW